MVDDLVIERIGESLERIAVALEGKVDAELVAELKPTFGVDGDQFYFLYGKNLHSGVAGFGRTANEAMLDFNKNFYGQLAAPPKK